MPSALPLTEQTTAARLERLPNSRWHVTVTIILGVAIFFDSFDSLAIAYVLPAIVPAWHIPPSSIGGLISVANFGQALGALTFGWAAERIGRVATARLAIALFAVMSLACAFTQNYEQLFVLRFLEGIGLGGEIPVASTYISEILRAERRGGRFLAYQMIFPVGLLASGIVGAVVVPKFGWQWMFIIGAVPAFIALFLQRYCPESPRWLASKGRLTEADAILSDIERIVSRNGKKPLPPVPASFHRSAIRPAGRSCSKAVTCRALSWSGSCGRRTSSPTAWRAGSRRSTARSITCRCNKRSTIRSRDPPGACSARRSAPS
jgi:putative MFS transporter